MGWSISDIAGDDLWWREGGSVLTGDVGLVGEGRPRRWRLEKNVTLVLAQNRGLEVKGLVSGQGAEPLLRCSLSSHAVSEQICLGCLSVRSSYSHAYPLAPT